jgi:hypothetical protein
VHIKTGDHTLLSIVPGTSDVRVNESLRFHIVRERLHYFSLDGIRAL